jgi:hypothetical protein
VVQGDRRGKGQEAAGDADPQTAQGAGAVTLKGEDALHVQ